MGDQTGCTIPLRVFTTLIPDFPKEYFDDLRYYLEQKLSCKIDTISEEERWRGSEVTQKSSPFDNDEADFGFISAADYIRTKLHAKNKNFELLPVGALHRHPNAHGKPIYFSDVVLRVADKDRLKEFRNARGTAWAYSTSDSLSGSLYPRHHFRKEGENVSFFGDTREAGSHNAAIEMVRDGRAEGATVNSAVAFMYFQRNPQARNDIFIKLTLPGSLPIYPIVVDKKLSAETKQKLKDAFLSIAQDTKMKTKLDRYGVDGFAPTYEEITAEPRN
ncbi:uncharacterized protein LOC129581245 isoform X2 [Paramacrobiotus metropolitanus]|uniref:uncharacterized protein LOC129581245 isoform X2 n=1 Tax=Paramacrobiotus metropolitanus TaxID=2943436 RepID=UPI002445A423|nr:uncharacterized protein LOC129581245 isoform X2 [Paramacrobiotus metropolitanus]